MDILLWLLSLDPGQPDVLMGLLGGLFGSKPKKPKETANDRALADVSQGQMNRYENRFAPQTKRLDRLSEQDKSSTLRGRGNADVMQSMGAARAPGTNGRLPSATRTGTRALGTALTGGSEQATDRSTRLTEGVMKAATGAGQEAITGLGQATQISTDRAIRKMKTDQADGRLMMDVLGSAAGGAAAVGMNRKAPAGGTSTKLGTFARNDYNMRTGKGGF